MNRGTFRNLARQTKKRRMAIVSTSGVETWDTHGPMPVVTTEPLPEMNGRDVTYVWVDEIADFKATKVDK